jgi:endonuclease YncB( thermonuclease family)
MDRSTRFYWLIVFLLLAAAAFFSVQVRQHESGRVLREVALESGDVVQVSTVIDGDHLVVHKDGAGRATVRLLGIRALDAKQSKDEWAIHGRLAAEALRAQTDQQYLRVLTNVPPRDRQGRALVTLYAGTDDIGLWMVSKGHAMVYTVYPFANMSAYLQAQQAARQQRLGLWASRSASTHADSLAREWARTSP